jgi:hypothetical protein
MNKIRMDVHPMEKALLETIRNEIVFGSMTIEIQDRLPVHGEAIKAYDFRRMVKEKTGTEG